MEFIHDSKRNGNSVPVMYPHRVCRNMIAQIAIAMLLLFGTHNTGYTSRYAPGVMGLQTAYHAAYDDTHIAPCEGCAVAVSDCSRIGDIMLIRPIQKKPVAWIPVIVSDCGGKDSLDENGKSWMDKANILVELSYSLAVKFGALNSIEIEVIK